MHCVLHMRMHTQTKLLLHHQQANLTMHAITIIPYILVLSNSIAIYCNSQLLSISRYSDCCSILLIIFSGLGVVGKALVTLQAFRQVQHVDRA